MPVTRIAPAIICLALAACSSGGGSDASGSAPSRSSTVATASALDPYLMTRDDSCYTVDLFTPARIKVPGRDTPEAWRAFSGRWGGGAWEGEWCHDLYVLEIKQDGTVHVIDTHAPLPEWGKLATAFRRTGRIDSDGRLRLSYGHVDVEYWIEDGKLLGHRDEGRGQWEIAMVRR